jgi:hypothetical protein
LHLEFCIVNYTFQGKHMSHRLRLAVSVLAVGLGVLWLTTTRPAADQQRPAAAAGQGPAAAAAPRPPASTAKPYKAPRTPDGQPDLQGFWSNATYTPLERAANVTKEYYTPEEFEKVKKDAVARDETQTTPGTTADVHYDFTQFGLDKSQHTIAYNLRTSMIIDPPDGRIPPPTPEALKRAADLAAERKTRGGQYDQVQNMPIGSRCIIMGGAGPPMRDAGYNSTYQIVQAPGTAMVLTEMIHDVRVIPLDGRPAPPAGLKQWMGVSRGRWEGETLVVETTNFNGRNPVAGGRGGGAGSTDQLKVTERFTRVSDDQIEYRFTVEDPQTWTKPWTALAVLQKTNGPIFEFACHESNYGVANILAGARADEQREKK